jgi:ATP-dependent DNA ligase
MPKKPLPQFVPPMQASSVKEPFDSPDWIFETKLDGYRAIAVIDATGKARLWSRNHLPLEPKFPTIQDAVRQLKLCSTILDGEIVALDKEGVLRFQLLQQPGSNQAQSSRPQSSRLEVPDRFNLDLTACKTKSYLSNAALRLVCAGSFRA